MIDLHSHILPGIDDGSESLDMTQQLLQKMQRQGIETVVATPHFYAFCDQPEAFLERRDAALAQLETLQGNFPKVIVGAEVAYFDSMAHSGILEQLTLGDSNLLLVEMPFCPWSPRLIKELCDLPLQTGLTPVLAHVDRYRRAGQLLGNMDLLLENGVLFQCNAETLLAPFSRRWALSMLKEHKIHFLGSDAHNLTQRAPNMDRAAAVIVKKLGQEAFDNLTAFTRTMLNL